MCWLSIVIEVNPPLLVDLDRRRTFNPVMRERFGHIGPGPLRRSPEGETETLHLRLQPLVFEDQHILLVSGMGNCSIDAVEAWVEPQLRFGERLPVLRPDCVHPVVIARVARAFRVGEAAWNGRGPEDYPLLLVFVPGSFGGPGVAS